MAKKALIKDSEGIILPITRGELVLDSSGKEAFHSESFLANKSQPGLISKENYSLLNTLNNENSVKVLVNSNNKIEWVAPDILNNEFFKTPTNVDLSTTWSNEAVVIFDTGFSNGLYLIKITLDSLIFSGVASVYVGDINVDDEIVLHASGISDDFRIYAKIANAGDYGGLYLSANKNRSAITNLSITMKKMI